MSIISIAPGEWKDVSDESGFNHHWKRQDIMRSLRLADESVEPLHGMGEGWSVEMFPHPEESDDEWILWEHFDDRWDAVARCSELMSEY